MTHSVMPGDPAGLHRAFEWTGFGPRCTEFLAATGGVMSMFGSAIASRAARLRMPRPTIYRLPLPTAAAG
ncbi:hypothetical protein [Mycolicibacterium moriokaense]|uniref:hypothetical protein n=1 Tax=Mycolicibacterium moriokaense TaxID=39691 RepID=UPI0011B3EC52|nr:hypothetical protein [Mycolicibacterium moriokaense]